MQSMAFAPLAVLLELEALRIILLVLCGRVIAALAISARLRDQCSHEYSFYSLIVRNFFYNTWISQDSGVHDNRKPRVHAVCLDSIT